MVPTVPRSRGFDAGIDPASRFLPDGLARIAGFAFLSPAEQRFIGRIQGRSYANLLGLLRFTEEKLKSRWLYLQLEDMMAAHMPEGYRFVPAHAPVANLVGGRSAWSVLALTCLFALSARVHYRHSTEAGAALDPLWKDVILFHWKQESQHALQDEQAWRREDARLDAPARDRAVGDLILLAGALDGILQAQARADAGYFAGACGRSVHAAEQARVAAALLHAYRWQFLLSGVQVRHFGALLGGMLDAGQYGRIAAALAPLFDSNSLPGILTISVAGR
jgi:hypothetical protein